MAHSMAIDGKIFFFFFEEIIIQRFVARVYDYAYQTSFFFLFKEKKMDMYIYYKERQVIRFSQVKLFEMWVSRRCHQIFFQW